MRILLLAALMLGCAESAAQLEDQSLAHARQAQALAQAGNYAHASDEQQKAAELHKDAVERAIKEGRAGDLTFVRPQ